MPILSNFHGTFVVEKPVVRPFHRTVHLRFLFIIYIMTNLADFIIAFKQ